MSKTRIAFSVAALAAGTAHADLMMFNPGDLGPDLLIDEAAIGGADLVVDNGIAPFAAFEVKNLWNVGDQVSITGIGLPLWANNDSASNNTVNGSFTFSFYGLGGGSLGEQYEGLAVETLLGQATVDFNGQNTGVAVFASLFDESIDFIADSTGFAFRVESTGAFRLKRGVSEEFRQIRIDNGNRAGGSPQFGSFTFSGTAVPAPASASLLSLALLGATRRRR